MQLSRNIRNLKQVPRRLIVETVLAGFCLELLALGLPIFVQVVFDKVVVHHSPSTLHVVAIGMFLISLLEGALLYSFWRNSHFLSAAVDVALTAPVIQKLMEYPLRYFENGNKGAIASHLRDISDIRTLLSASSIALVVDVMFLICVLGLLALYSTALALVVALALPILAVSSWGLRPMVHRLQSALVERRDIFESLLSEGLHSIGTIKKMGLEPWCLHRWTKAYGEYVHSSLHAKRAAAIEDVLLLLLQRFVVLTVLWVGASEVLNDELSPGQLLASYMFSLRVLAPSVRIFQVYVGYSRIKKAMSNVDALINEPSESGGAGQARRTFAPGALTLTNVTFRYGTGHAPVLEDVNLTVPCGSSLAITGLSGSGKSTLSKMLQRHLSPQEGCIEIGGIDIRDFDLQSLRQGITLLTHDATIFRGTIYSNILGRTDTPGVQHAPERISHCCRLAGMVPMMESFPQGLDTHVDETGQQLSAGQRQRVALARALYAQPHVLILDEATNALDAESERDVMRFLREEFSTRILIVVSHRPHILSDLDAVVRIDRHRIHPTNF